MVFRGVLRLEFFCHELGINCGFPSTPENSPDPRLSSEQAPKGIRHQIAEEKIFKCFHGGKWNWTLGEIGGREESLLPGKIFLGEAKGWPGGPKKPISPQKILMG
jgi:hypothetical protein